jgi:hypothetical protein
MQVTIKGRERGSYGTPKRAGKPRPYEEDH